MKKFPQNFKSTLEKTYLASLKKFFEENEVNIKGKFKAFSTPNRLVIYVDKIQKNINKKSEEIRGPSTKAPEEALDGFIRSNKIKKSQIYKKMTEKGDFYFYKRPSKKLIPLI